MRLAIVIGHSPRHPGATAVDGVPEYEFHRHSASRLASAALVAGHEVEVFQRLPSLGSMIARINGSPWDLVLSLHFNAAPEAYKGQWHGTMCLHHPASREGAVYARQVSAACARAQGTRDRGPREQIEASEGRGRIAILTDTRWPAVLLETHFGCNAEDHRRATVARDSDATARAIVAALPTP